MPGHARIISVGATLMGLTSASARQFDLLRGDDVERSGWERITASMDALNSKYGRTLVSIGPWTPPPGGYAGGKISYTRIPSAEDFW